MIPGWHPLVVHFPLVLCTTGAIALLFARLLPDDRHARTLATVGTWNLCAGAAATLFAIGTGIAALVGLHVGVAARGAIAVHVKWAILASMMMVLLAVWRGAGNAQDDRPSGLMLILLVAATTALLYTGYRGDLNVYRYGVGVAVRAPCGEYTPHGAPGRALSSPAGCR